MRDFLQGATMLASFAVAVFFLRYWRQTRDRLFGVFAAAFALFGVNRILLAILDDDSEARTWVYALRALMFIAIIVAIIDKNLSHRDHDDLG
ncbi:MAG TPA: DUF5985 family protein [Mycobacteriales bacterium]|nr:DUF5985 family protein [Mycobacteriales bacterium]